jgi:FAD-dependent oxidoreductase domain-containing protein 1
MIKNFDVVIAGGAVIGSSTAYQLALQSQGRLKILVVEPDPTYQFSASALSAGSIRQQFSTAINIDISLYGINFLRHIGEHLAVDGDKPDIGLHEGGYLYLATDSGAKLLSEINAVQNSRGADIALYDQQGLSQKFPWLNTEDLAAGSWGSTGEGWFDGYGLCQAFKRKARSLGVVYLQARVIGVSSAAGTISHVQLDDGHTVGCDYFVNCAGASGARVLAEKMGYPIPVYAKKRCVFPFSCQQELQNFPLVIDTSGVWVRPEGKDFIAGYSPDDLDETDHGKDFEVDWPLFEEVIWPALAARVPVFESIRPGRAWAGHYDMCLLDHNAVVGLLPGLTNGFLAAGFSGHGLQQSPAIGRGIAELVIHQTYTSLDLSPLGCERLITGQRLLERNVI